jgi:hypothetical protein
MPWIGPLVQALEGLFTKLGKVFEIMAIRKSGHDAARLEAAERELERANERRKIEGDVSGLDPDELERRLHKQSD